MFHFAAQTSLRPYIYDTYPRRGCRVKRIWDVSCLCSNKHNKPKCSNQSQQSNTCLFNLSREGKPNLFVSVAVGQDSSERLWTTNTDTHSLGSLSCPPIKGVYRRLPHDVIPAPNAKLITTIDPGMRICVYVDMCVRNSTCQSKPLLLMSPELE